MYIVHGGFGSTSALLSVYPSPSLPYLYNIRVLFITTVGAI